MRAKFRREVAALGLPSIAPGPIVTLDDLAPLPLAAQKYLRFMEVVGRPRVRSFESRSVGMFRMGPNARWMPCEIWQYDFAPEITRIFHMRLRMGGLVPTYVRDTYVRGQGRMLGRMLDRVVVVEDHSEKISTGELVTYLNDAIFIAPSMLLDERTKWIDVDGHSFDVALTDHGRTVTARVLVDGRGAVTDFVTTDRFGTDPAHPKSGLVRARWTTPVEEWGARDGRPFVRAGRAVWHFPTVEFSYGDLRTVELTFDAPPSPGA